MLLKKELGHGMTNWGDEQCEQPGSGVIMCPNPLPLHKCSLFLLSPQSGAPAEPAIPMHNRAPSAGQGGCHSAAALRSWAEEQTWCHGVSTPAGGLNSAISWNTRTVSAPAENSCGLLTLQSETTWVARALRLMASSTNRWHSEQPFYALPSLRTHTHSCENNCQLERLHASPHSCE